MVKKTSNKNAERTNKNSINNAPPKHLSKKPTYTIKKLSNDEVIKSLANTYENKRARQVTEWERVQRRNLIQTV